LTTQSEAAYPTTVTGHQDPGQRVLKYGIAAMVLATMLMAPGVELFVGADGRFRSLGSSLAWDRWIVALHLISDLLIGGAYVAISVTLLYLARKAQEEIPFLWVFMAFGAFIIACGFTHFVAALTVWTPVYWAWAGIKVVTAVSSVATALVIPPIVPQVLSIIRLAREAGEQKDQLARLNSELEERVAQRTEQFAKVNRELSQARDELEGRVVERTAQVTAINTALRLEIADRERMAVALQESRQLFDQAIVGSAAGMALMSKNGAWIKVNRALCELVGYAEGELLQRTFQDITHPDDLEADLKYVRETLAGEQRAYQLEKRYIHKDGSTVWILLGVSLMRDDQGEPHFFIAQMQDISARKRMEATLETLLAERTAALEVVEHRALHDGLTELPNRTLLYDRLTQAIRTAQRETGHVALLFLDLDGFKGVNDTLGHHIGDLLLQQVADRLRATLRESDTAARLGGDEFAILLPTEQAAGAEIVSRKLLQAVDAPYQVEGHRLVVSASTGIALFPDHGNSTEELMRRADVAMYEAKRGRLGVAVYSVDRDINTKSRLALIAELREATEKNDLVLQFQPKLTLLDMSVGAVEALVRWQHPERGLLFPQDFIPLAEEIGFIHPIFRWVLDAALKACRSWENAGTILNVAVNLSATDLRDAQLVALVAETLQAHGLAPHRLTLELTETTVMDSRDDAQAILVLLHELGVRISVDDFGVGYSSLAYLARLSVHELKVDRSFIRHLNSPGPDRLIVQSVLDLGRHLDLALVAEGVEDRETLDLLRNLGCDYAQGYHIARPMFAGDLLNWLKP